MIALLERKVSKSGGSLIISLPYVWAREFGIRPNDVVRVTVDEAGCLRIHPPEKDQVQADGK